MSTHEVICNLIDSMLNVTSKELIILLENNQSLLDGYFLEVLQSMATELPPEYSQRLREIEEFVTDKTIAPLRTLEKTSIDAEDFYNTTITTNEEIMGVLFQNQPLLDP